MSTKNKGDILAETIEEILNFPATPESPAARIKQALAEYRRPWTLGRSVNGFALAEGQEWHRQDWTQDMLTDGWRPLLMGERTDGKTDEARFDTGNDSFTVQAGVLKAGDSAWLFWRTRRPLPADKWAAEKQAFREGKTIQWRHPRLTAGQWSDLSQGSVYHAPESWRGDENCEYRVKPAPVLVPLGPADVKCGDEIVAILGNQNRLSIVEVSPLGIYTWRTDQTWKELQEFCVINRNDGRGFVRCEKEAK